MEERDTMFKIGTKVKLRDYLKVGSYYGGVKFEDFCKQDFGKVLTITKVTPCNGYISTTKYEFEETPLEYTVEMLEPITETKAIKYKVGDKVILNPKRVNKPGVFTIEEITSDDGNIFYKLSCDKAGGWLQENIIKVPLFKIGQIVQVKDIKNDKWFISTMSNLEGESGIITEVTEKIYNENYYQPTKAGEDGCRYRVKILGTCNEWSISSASLQPVSTITTMEDDRNISQDDSGPQGDLGVIATTATTAEAMAQAVDNVKPKFKIGDRVLIREDLIPGKMYAEWGGWCFLSDMAQHMGKVAKVIDYGYDDPNYLRLDVDNGEKSWIINALLPYTPGSDYDLDKQIINQQKTIKQNENRLQEKGTAITGRERQSGCAVRYPGEQIRVGISNLGYRKVTCKR